MMRNVIIYFFTCICVAQILPLPFEDIGSCEPNFRKKNSNVSLSSVFPEISIDNDENSILIYFNSSDVYGERYFTKIVNYLESFDYKVEIINPSSKKRISEILPGNYSQFWFISGDYYNPITIDEKDVQAIISFSKENKGIVIWSDDSTRFQNDANLISSEIGITFSGLINNASKDSLISFNDICITRDHPISAGLHQAMFSSSDGHLMAQDEKQLLPIFFSLDTLTWKLHIISGVVENETQRIYLDANLNRIHDDFIDMNHDNFSFINSLVDWLEGKKEYANKKKYKPELAESNDKNEETKRDSYPFIVDFKAPEMVFSSNEPIVDEQFDLQWMCNEDELTDTAFVIDVFNEGYNQHLEMNKEICNYCFKPQNTGELIIIFSAYDIYGNHSLDTLQYVVQKKK